MLDFPFASPHSLIEESFIFVAIGPSAGRGCLEWFPANSQGWSIMTSQPRRRRLEVEDIGDVTVVNFTDRKILDEQNIQVIGEQLFSLVDEAGRRKILLNFGNVEYLSSAALGKLITLNKKLQTARRPADPVQHRPADLRSLRDHQAQQAVQHSQGRASRPSGVLTPIPRSEPSVLDPVPGGMSG